MTTLFLSAVSVKHCFLDEFKDRVQGLRILRSFRWALRAEPLPGRTHAASAPPGTFIVKTYVALWDMGAGLGRDGGTDESMSPEFG